MFGASSVRTASLRSGEVLRMEPMPHGKEYFGEGLVMWGTKHGARGNVWMGRDPRRAFCTAPYLESTQDAQAENSDVGSM